MLSVAIKGQQSRGRNQAKDRPTPDMDAIELVGEEEISSESSDSEAEDSDSDEDVTLVR